MTHTISIQTTRTSRGFVCGSPNHSVSVTTKLLSSFESVNSFSILSSDAESGSESVSSPQAARVPADGNKGQKQTPGLRHTRLKVLNINFRSINNSQTRDEFHALFNHVKPDIVVGSETWLNSEVYDAEIVPEDLGYELFRRDRSSRGGGVLILVSRIYIAHREEKMESDCEILWVKVEIVGSKPLHTAAYYRPHESDNASQEQLRISLEKVSEVKGHIWLLGDFNLPKFSWAENLPSLKQDCNYPSLYGDFADIMADFNLTQMVTEPTRYENTLDLFLTNNPTLVSKVEIMPGLSNHDIVYSEVNIKPQIVTQKPRVMPFMQNWLNTCSNSVNPSWWITKLNHLTDYG